MAILSSSRHAFRPVSSSSRLFSTSHLTLAHHKYVVVGGGTAGLTVTSQLIKALKGSKEEIKDGDIVVVDKKRRHDYQPGWTLAGTGLANLSDLSRPEASLIPSPAKLIPSNAASFSPETNSLRTEEGEDLTYDYLVLAPGLQLNTSSVKGLVEALKDPNSGVSSVYEYECVEKTWENIRKLRKGKAIFTQPAGVIKCAGAPQKVMWMAVSTWVQNGVRDQIEPTFITGTPTMFGVPKYSLVLDALRKTRKISALFSHNLVEVIPAEKKAVFVKPDGEKVIKEFDLLHVVPPQGALEVFKGTVLADESGYISVSPTTLQHVKYPNIFSLGDGSSIPTSKTAAAISAQAPVLVDNLVSLIRGEELRAGYDGYTSCPLLTGHNELMLAEFKFGGVPKESFEWLFGSQDKPRLAFYLLKTKFFPWVYWNNFVKGTWFGTKGWIKPTFR